MKNKSDLSSINGLGNHFGNSDFYTTLLGIKKTNSFTSLKLNSSIFSNISPICIRGNLRACHLANFDKITLFSKINYDFNILYINRKKLKCI